MEPQRPENALECSFCYYAFHKDMPHYSCSEMHPEAQTGGFDVCQACFFRWMHGEFRADNVGFVARRCRCNQRVSYEEVKQVLDPAQFEAYDQALTHAVLSRDEKVLHCPGVDCLNAFYKPKRSKRPCRKSVCSECETVFCCQCGELYTKEHQRMKCGPYKRWKKDHDQDTIAMEQWRQAEAREVRPCPGCKRDIEKNFGCNDMRCTNCGVRFCWRCMSVVGRTRNNGNWCKCVLGGQ